MFWIRWRIRSWGSDGEFDIVAEMENLWVRWRIGSYSSDGDLVGQMENYVFQVNGEIDVGGSNIELDDVGQIRMRSLGKFFIQAKVAQLRLFSVTNKINFFSWLYQCYR